MNDNCCNVPDDKPAKASYVKKEVEDINKMLAEHQKDLSRDRLVCIKRDAVHNSAIEGHNQQLNDLHNNLAEQKNSIMITSA